MKNDILEHKMKIQNVNNIKFMWCHCLAPEHLNSTRPRTVIFKLKYDREIIWNKKNKLKNTSIWLNEDFPVKINMGCSFLLPIFHEFSAAHLP